MNEEEQKPQLPQDIGLIRPPINNTPQSVRLEAALAEEKEKKRQADIKPIKTYQSDVAEAIKRDNVSVIKMALAEKRRQEREVIKQKVFPTESKKGLLFFALSILLIILGIGIVGYFLFSHSGKGEISFTVDAAKNLIYVEKNTEIKIDNDDPREIIDAVNKLKQQPLPKGSIENLVVTAKGLSTTTLLSRQAITAGDFINVFRTRIPAAFFRSIQDPYIFGLYSGSNGVETFMVLKTDSFDNAYSGMLDWENNFQRDIGDLFAIPTNLNPTPATISASSSGTTSAATLQPSAVFSFLPKKFEDRVIDNRDSRVLIDQNGRVVFLYSFIDSSTLVFTTGSESFNEILNRYIQTKKER
jgi:hypothetical protein